MRAADLTTAVVLFLLGGIVLADAIRLGIGWGTDGPKSGFFPFWLAVVMMTTCVAIAAQAAWRRADTPFVTREQLGPVLKVLWPATAMVAAACTSPPRSTSASTCAGSGGTAGLRCLRSRSAFPS